MSLFFSAASTAVSRFLIPMRGNETGRARREGQRGDEFLIPMRGNEVLRELNARAVVPIFLIPMRGNENFWVDAEGMRVMHS